MMRIDSQARTIQQLLANTKYRLDYYQREYSWETKHVTELLDDLANQFFASYTEGDGPANVATYGHYFLGSIIISHNEGQRYIVDGQQRLTTLTLLLIRLYRLIEEEALKNQVGILIYSLSLGTEGFNLDVPEWQSVMKSLYEDTLFDETDESESIQNIVLRYSDIEDYFEIQDQQALSSFVYWLLGNVYLVEIAAYDSKDAYMIFETVNDRGLSLTHTDMLRGYLLSHITDTTQRSQASQVWNRRIETINKQKGKEDESDAIKAWLRSQYAEEIGDFDRIGSEFHRWVRERESELGITSSDGFVDFIERNFEFYGRWYCRLRDAANSLIPELECVYYNAQNNFTLQYPIVLSVLQVDDSDEDIQQKIHVVTTYLDIFIHRRIWNFQNITHQSMAAPMFSLVRDIRGKNLEELIDLLSMRLETQTLNFANNSLFHLHGGNRPKIHLILARMTDYVEVQSGQVSRYLEYVKTGVNSYEIEHIWANHPEHHLDEFPLEFEFEGYRNRIGGLLLLPKKINASLGDLPYDEKYELYIRENLLAKSLHEQTYQNNPGFKQFIDRSRLPFRAHPEFKKADLDARQELYRRLAEQIWNPERLKLDYGDEPDPIISIAEEGEAYGDNNHTVWTAEEIRGLVPPERRKYYETQHKNKIGEFYRRVADLRNRVEREWGKLLDIRFQRNYCGFYFENKRIFGVSLYGPPRFSIWITREEAEQFREHCEFDVYYSGGVAVYPRDVTLDILFPILEFAYRKRRGY